MCRTHFRFGKTLLRFHVINSIQQKPFSLTASIAQPLAHPAAAQQHHPRGDTLDFKTDSSSSLSAKEAVSDDYGDSSLERSNNTNTQCAEAPFETASGTIVFVWFVVPKTFATVFERNKFTPETEFIRRCVCIKKGDRKKDIIFPSS